MNKKQQYTAILSHFQATMPAPRTELQYKDPYQLTVAVMLSAQCTDKRVNQTTPSFFTAYPDIETLAAADPATVARHIKSVSYPNSKAAHLVAMARKVASDCGGQIPCTIDDLMTLPGVGRKTANVVASVAFGIPALAVDTHVFRVAGRTGLVDNARTPEETERELTRNIPRQLWSKAHHWLILHGRYTCTARNPKCTECNIAKFCKSANPLTAGRENP
jgi:endonuclease-3